MITIMDPHGQSNAKTAIGSSYKQSKYGESMMKKSKNRNQANANNFLQEMPDEDENQYE